MRRVYLDYSPRITRIVYKTFVTKTVHYVEKHKFLMSFGNTLLEEKRMVTANRFWAVTRGFTYATRVGVLFSRLYYLAELTKIEKMKKNNCK